MSIETYILSTPHISYLEQLHLCVKTAIQNIQMPLFTVAFNEITDEEVVDVTLGDVDDRENGRKNRENTKKSPYNGI